MAEPIRFTQCEDCGRMISDRLAVCAECGGRNQRPILDFPEYVKMCLAKEQQKIDWRRAILEGLLFVTVAGAILTILYMVSNG